VPIVPILPTNIHPTGLLQLGKAQLRKAPTVSQQADVPPMPAKPRANLALFFGWHWKLNKETSITNHSSGAIHSQEQGVSTQSK